MLLACFGITLPVAEMFKVDLNACSWFAEQIKRRGEMRMVRKHTEKAHISR